MTTHENLNPRGWICISKSHDSYARASEGYKESLGLSYEWRLGLPKGHDIAVGDVIVIRDNYHVLGFSLIEKIEKKRKLYSSNRCPNCDRAQVEERVKKMPKYRCRSCAMAFAEPLIVSEKEEFRVAHYAPGWVSLDKSSLTKSLWMKLSVTPKSQHSLQSIDQQKFGEFLKQLDPSSLVPFNCRNPLQNHGHKLGTAKIRIGQAEFRKKLFSSFGNVCAMTGPNHQTALEASHLYSYSDIGVHHDDGGLLLRRDIHRLFDSGLIAINPETLCVDISQDLHEIDAYIHLKDMPLFVELNQGQKKWVSVHWKEHRR